MKEKRLTSERGTVYYWIEKQSDAKTLVFLPGLTANHHLFDAQIEHFVRKYTVLVWDAPAHGKSRPYRAFSYSHLAEELRAILDAERIEQAVLIGQSAGGFVAQSFVERFPDMVEGIFGIGTCPYGTEYYSQSDIFWLKQIGWMAKMYPDQMLRQGIARMCAATERGRRNMLQMLRDYQKEELCYLMHLGFAGFLPEIRDVTMTCPVWLAVGEKDRTGKVRKYNAMWHKKTGYPLYVIPGAAHNANDDCPEVVNGLIEKLVQAIDNRGEAR